MKKITSLIVTVIAIVAVLPTTFVYAQTTTSNTTAANTTGNATTTTAPIQSVTPSAAAAQQIINNTKTECEQAQFPQARCVVSVYESPTTVVLSGLVKIFGGGPESRGLYPNSFLWNAVDDFKAQGYTITEIGMNIVGGNKSSDNEYHVIMSK